MANVTVTLPLNTLDMLDDLVEKGKVGSRSQAVREALEKFLNPSNSP
jgi:Arc/MetJ-type ribon-helix-helix transcriptional regulator